MEEAKKTLINEKTISSFSTSYNVRFGIAVGITGAAAIFSLIIAPAISVKLVLFLILSGFCAIFIVARVKKGRLNYYFKEMAVTNKEVRSRYGDDNEEITTYYLFFGEYNYSVIESDYERTNIGDKYYVMFEAKTEAVAEIYDVNKYELAPGLDIR